LVETVLAKDRDFQTWRADHPSTHVPKPWQPATQPLAETYHYAIDESFIERDIERGESNSCRASGSPLTTTIWHSPGRRGRGAPDGHFQHPHREDLIE